MSAGTLKIWRIWFVRHFFFCFYFFPFSFLANIANFFLVFFVGISPFFAVLAASTLGSLYYEALANQKPACNFVHHSFCVRLFFFFCALSSANVAMCSFVTSSAFGRVGSSIFFASIFCFAVLHFSLPLLLFFLSTGRLCVRKIGDLEQFYFRIVFM